MQKQECNYPKVICKNGVFEGFTDEDTGVQTFLGIPYAKPPVGGLRWKAPVAAEPSDEVRMAKKFGKSSIQSREESEPASMNTIGEDCLTLNVWAGDLTKEKKPVMVYFHGGGFFFGGTSDPLYNGRYFVAEHKDILLVSCNYRLGIMGFADFSNVPGGEDFPDGPDLALLDHICALEWIRDNIEAFGGDPGNVTIFGESAGGATTSCLMVCERAKGLFHKCISESGAINLTYSKEELEQWALIEKLMKISGCRNADELVAMSEEDLIRYYTTPYDEDGSCLSLSMAMPLRGGKLIPEDPYQALKDGISKDVIWMAGSNANEWNYWLELMEGESIEERIKNFEKFIVDVRIQWIRDAASAEEFANVEKLIDELGGDVWAKTEICNFVGFHTAQVKAILDHVQGGGKGYMYYFAKESTKPLLKACHACEVAYVFNNPAATIFAGTVDKELAGKVSSRWAEFARSGNPGDDWSEYDNAGRSTMVIGNDNSMTLKQNPMGTGLDALWFTTKYFLN